MSMLCVDLCRWDVGTDLPIYPDGYREYQTCGVACQIPKLLVKDKYSNIITNHGQTRILSHITL